MTELPKADRCLDWDICDLPKYHVDGCCILHWAKTPLSRDQETEFRITFNDLIERGHTNFEKVCFLKSFTITNLHILEILNFKDIRFSGQSSGNLEFIKVVFEKGLLFSSTKLGQLSFRKNCIANGPVTIEVENLPGASMVVFDESDFNQNVTIKSQGKINFVGEHKTVFGDGLNIQTESLNELRLDTCTINSTLDIQNCIISNPLDLSNVKFSSESEVNLNSSTLYTNFEYKPFSIGDSSVPRILHINGLTTQGPVVLASPSLGFPMKVIAPTDPPRFNWAKEVRIKNCDLSECCLLGNNLENFKFTNVQWLHWHPVGKFSMFGRDILKDELRMRDRHSKNSVEIRYLKESYQTLKEQYQQKGNQLQAGYFHYGEMEMKRHAGGWKPRFFSLEFLYWLLNGYGMGWGRAVSILTFITVGASIIYWAGDTSETCHTWFYWLRHSIKVGTFQRPELISNSEFSEWTQVIQSIWSPVQIGLLGLAIRMRVRR